MVGDNLEEKVNQVALRMKVIFSQVKLVSKTEVSDLEVEVAFDMSSLGENAQAISRRRVTVINAHHVVHRVGGEVYEYSRGGMWDHMPIPPVSADSSQAFRILYRWTVDGGNRYANILELREVEEIRLKDPTV